MIAPDLPRALAELPPATELHTAHLALLAEAVLAPQAVRDATSRSAAAATSLRHQAEATLARAGVTAALLEQWRVADAPPSVATAAVLPRYRLAPVLDWLRERLVDGGTADRLARVFPMLSYADGAREDFLGSLAHPDDPVRYWLLTIDPAMHEDGVPAHREFLHMLRADPEAAVALAQTWSARTRDSVNPANWLLAVLSGPSLRAHDLDTIAEALVLLNDHDIGLGINAYGAADRVEHGLHRRLSFTVSHLVAALSQTDRLLTGSALPYASLVTTLIKLGADFSLADDEGRHVLEVATQVRHAHVSSPFLNIIDKFLLVQQLDEIMLHGDDENAEKI